MPVEGGKVEGGRAIFVAVLQVKGRDSRLSDEERWALVIVDEFLIGEEPFEPRFTPQKLLCVCMNVCVRERESREERETERDRERERERCIKIQCYGSPFKIDRIITP